MFNGMNFKSFTLDNQLQVLAISDKRFVKSSAALAVMAGSMQNPDEHLGLAHFLEHLLFLGTDKYPEVGAYEDFLNKNGGGHNAYTSIDHTNYFFDIAHSGFEGALERFSKFFICPTFDDKYVERERNAVHSEHEKNLKDDGRREYRFLQVITDPKHPFSKFATGDKNTLANANRDVVMKFYKEKYSSNLMRLVLMSPLPENELENLANKYFAEIDNKNLSMPTYSDDLFLKSDVHNFHKMETIRDKDVLKISFDMPDDIPYWESKPSQFLAHLLGEEGEGSILSYLKSHGLALGLETSTWWRMFHIKISLTEKGKKDYEEVIKIIFSAIEMFKKEGLKDYIFNERKVIAETDLNFIEPKSSMGRASQYSASMLYYPVDHFLSQHYLFHKHSPDEFNTFIDRLNVDNMQVTLLSKETANEKTETYYGIGYRSDKFEEELLNEFRNPKTIPEIQYPIKNQFLPDNLELIKKPAVYDAQEEKYKGFATLYSQIDTELQIPKGSISMSFIADKVQKDPKKYLLAKVFAKIKKEELNEWGYAARLAGLNYNISHGYNTITLDVSGYSQHLVSLLNLLIKDEDNNRIINKVQISNDRFEDIKTKLKKAMENREFDAAYQRLLSENSFFFSTASIHFNDYKDLIDEITIEEVNEFSKEFFQEFAMRVFCYGNIDIETVKPSVDKALSALKAKGLSEDDVEKFENKYVQLPNKNLAYQVAAQNNNNSQLSFYHCGEWNLVNQAHLDVLAKVLEQPFFTELRTHQQLGYIVAAFTTSSQGYCGIGTLIQSQTHGCVDIYNRADKFVKEFLTQLPGNISKQDLAAIQGSILAELTQMPNSMGERLSRFTLMAGTYHGDFKFIEKLCQHIQKVTQESLNEFIKDNILSKNFSPQLSFFYKGQGSKDEALPKNLEKIQDIQALRASQPSHQPYKHAKLLK